jgi:putative transposase
MIFQHENIYHIYNRGNNRESIFFEKRNYFYFLNKIKDHVCNVAELLGYCLMPNHFHLLVYIEKELGTNNLNNEIAALLRSYTRAINEQEDRVGSLFQQKTKAKNVTTYGLNYIHQNPYNSGLVSKLEDWEFSSFNEYIENTDNSLCNIELAKSLLGIPDKEEFYNVSNEMVNKDLLEKIF